MPPQKQILNQGRKSQGVCKLEKYEMQQNNVQTQTHNNQHIQKKKKKITQNHAEHCTLYKINMCNDTK
jgi:hypothetical protein